MSLYALITGNGPFPQGFVAPQSASKKAGLEFPSAALQGRISIPLDAIIRESVAKRNEVTSDPVEDGSDVNAHVIHRPDTVTIDAAVSDTPLVLVGTGLFQWQTGKSLSQQAYEAIDALVKSRLPFDLVGTFEYFKGYVFTDWNPMKTAREGSVLRFTATMQQLTIVSSELVPSANLAKPLKDGRKVSKGNVQPLPTIPKQASMFSASFSVPQSVTPTAGTL